MSVSWLTHLVGGTVRTLLDYVSDASICPKLRRILKMGPEWEEISDILSKKWPRASIKKIHSVAGAMRCYICSFFQVNLAPCST